MIWEALAIWVASAIPRSSLWTNEPKWPTPVAPAPR